MKKVSLLFVFLSVMAFRAEALCFTEMPEDSISTPSDAERELTDKCQRVRLHCTEDKKTGQRDSFLVTITYGADDDGTLDVEVRRADTGEPVENIFGGLTISPGQMAIGKRDNDLRILQRSAILQVKNTEQNVSLQYIAQDTSRPRSWHYLNLFGYSSDGKPTRFTVNTVDFLQRKERNYVAARKGYQPSLGTFANNLLHYWFFHGLYLYYNTKYAF